MTAIETAIVYTLLLWGCWLAAKGCWLCIQYAREESDA